MINPHLNPWNIYGNHIHPNPSTTANVYADNKEWYNSYMPPFFLLKDKKLIQQVRQQIDNNQPVDDTYFKSIRTSFSEQNRLNTIRNQYYRIEKFFDLSKKLIPEFNSIKDLDGLLCLLIKSINLMQLYLNPLEAVVTGKDSIYNPIKSIFPNPEKQLNLLQHCPSMETIFIPMAVIFCKSKTFSYKYNCVFRYLCNTLFCSTDDLKFAFRHVDKLYHYSRYMNVNDAKTIINLNATKIINLKSLTDEQKFAYHVQTISGILTWSKYIPISYKPLHFRYFCEIETYPIMMNLPEITSSRFLQQELAIKTTSGSEKFAKTIFAVKYFHSKNL